MSSQFNSINEMYFKALQRMPKFSSKSSVFSPYSLGAVLQMTALIADQEARNEVFQSLEMPDSFSQQQIKELAQQIDASGRNIVQSANSIWVAKDLQVEPNAFDPISEVTSIRPVQFPQPALDIINKYVEEKTCGLIPHLLDSLEEDSRYVIVNTLYFKCFWKSVFAPSDTYDCQFTAPSGPKTVRMMKKNVANNYFENSQYQMIEIPYAGDYKMTVILPLDKTAQALDSIDLRAALQQPMQPEEVKLCLPQFKIESSWSEIIQQMNAIGIKRLFTVECLPGRAYIDQIIQKAVIKTGEQGTEAAAATAAIMRCLMLQRDPPKSFVADHPFLYVISHNTSGTILFAGSVVDF